MRNHGEEAALTLLERVLASGISESEIAGEEDDASSWEDALGVLLTRSEARLAWSLVIDALRRGGTP